MTHQERLSNASRTTDDELSLLTEQEVEKSFGSLLLSLVQSCTFLHRDRCSVHFNFLPEKKEPSPYRRGLFRI
jgi:hypothetical protein